MALHYLLGKRRRERERERDLGWVKSGEKRGDQTHVTDYHNTHTHTDTHTLRLGLLANEKDASLIAP